MFTDCALERGWYICIMYIRIYVDSRALLRFYTRMAYRSGRGLETFVIDTQRIGVPVNFYKHR